MTTIQRHRPAPAPFAVLAACLLAALALGAMPGNRATAAGGPDCRNASASPSEVRAAKLRRAIKCLINVERTERGKSPVRTNDDLQGIARRHTRVMIEKKCFQHQCPGEATLRKRIERSGYLKGGGRYGYGENLGCAPTPKEMVSLWMKTRFHRRNILDGQFEHVGIGARQGRPLRRTRPGCKPAAQHATYTVLFAWRKPGGSREPIAVTARLP